MKSLVFMVFGIFGLTWFFQSSTYAESDPCPTLLKTYQDVLTCAEQRSPDILVANADVARAVAEVSAASQWKNPEFSIASVYGTSGGQLNAQSDLDFKIPIELGGKVAARSEVAQSGVAETKARAIEVQTRVQAEILIKLLRLRQVYHEQEVIEEAIGTFSKLLNQFSKRPKLSPEQQLSNTVFRMSKSEYEIKRSETVETLAGLRAFFRTSVGKEIEQLKPLAPKEPKAWPNVAGTYKFGTSPQAKLTHAENQTAQALLALAKNESWPTLSAGPAVQIQTQGGQTVPLFGISLGLPLPVFNMNGAGRFAAASGVSLAETRKKALLNREEKRREEVLRIYNESKRVLGTTLLHHEIEGRHQEIEALFFQGIVPSALVIEAHRTFVELELTRNQRELKALESLLSIQTIDGTPLEFPL